MANEISVTTSLSVTKGKLTLSRKGSFTADFVGSKYSAVVQSIGTMDEGVAINGLSTYGKAWLRNLDATNFIEVGFSFAGSGSDTDFYGFMRIPPGEMYVVHLVTPYIFARADSFACDLEIIVLEN